MDLEQQLHLNEKIKEKVKNDVYAQNLYAAFCNNQFFRPDGVAPWTCSWRMGAGIVAELRGCGEDYLNWYCSGMADKEGYVAESVITDEIRSDLLELGWTIQPYQ